VLYKPRQNQIIFSGAIKYKMAYNKFKLNDLTHQFGIENFNREFIKFAALKKFNLSEHLLIDLQEAKQEALASEKAKSEFIILPVLKELRRKNRHRFSYFSGYEFNVDKKQGLGGFCDVIFSSEPDKLTITAPIICLVEAKKGDIEQGLGQCGAEMYAAQLFNSQENKSPPAIYGCVTNAFNWCFLKLDNKNLLIDPNYIPLTFNNPEPVLQVLQWLLDECITSVPDEI
jgi:hypothetical protein